MWPFNRWKRQADTLVSEAQRDLVARTNAKAEQAQLRKAYGQGFAAAKRNHYNAAKAGRRTAKWGSRASSANAVTAANGRTLRERARHQVRNAPHAAKAKMVFTSSVVGDGVRPQIKVRAEGDAVVDVDGQPISVDDLNTKAERLFERWSRDCDADGRHDFYGLQRLVAGTIPSDGECLVRRRPRRMEDGLAVPLQLQVMEADHLDSGKSQLLRSNGQDRGRIIQGVELDRLGRRVAYYLFPFHPHDNVTPSVGISSEANRVPASEVAHIYHCDRPGQVRGVPWLAPIMMLLEDLEAYIDAEVLRKRIEAMVVATYKSASPDSKLFEAVEDGAPIVDVDGVPIGDLTAGEILCIPEGDEFDVKMPTVVSGIEEFVRTILRVISTGLGLNYELLAGDLSKVNFSSGRMGNIEWRRLARALRQVLIVRQFCDVTFRWWLQMAIAAGELPEADYGVEWVSPHFEEIDREKDLKADILGGGAGLYTKTELLKRRGKDFDTHVEELRVENEKLAKAGVAMDFSGATKALAPAPKAEEAEGKGDEKKDEDSRGFSAVG